MILLTTTPEKTERRSVSQVSGHLIKCVRFMSPCASVTIRNEGHLLGHKDRVFDLDWSSTSSLASVGQSGGFLWSIDASTAAKPSVVLPGTELMRVCWHGARVLTGSSDGTVRICAAADGAALATLQVAAEEEVYGLKVLPDNDLLAAGVGNSVQQWDLERAARVTQRTFCSTENGVIYGGRERNPGCDAYLFDLATSSNLICTALSDGTVRVLDSQTLHPVATLTGHAERSSPAFGVAISQTTQLLASADSRGTVLLWDLRLLGRGPLAETNHQQAVHSIEFLPAACGEKLITGGVDQWLHVHETTKLATEGSTKISSPLLCLAVDDITQRLATGGGAGGHSSDDSISLWCLDWSTNEANNGMTCKAKL